MNLITPLNRVLGLGSAKGGSEHWWVQRLTAVALIPLGLWLAISLAAFESISYSALVVWVQQPLTAVLLILTVSTLVYHSHLGVQVVLEDYVHAPGVKVVCLVLSAFAHVFLATATLFSILKVAFGAS